MLWRGGSAGCALEFENFLICIACLSELCGVRLSPFISKAGREAGVRVESDLLFFDCFIILAGYGY